MPSNLRAARAVERALADDRRHVTPDRVAWPRSAWRTPGFKRWREQVEGLTVCGRSLHVSLIAILPTSPRLVTCRECRRTLANWGIKP